jgi:hypothetical protein
MSEHIYARLSGYGWTLLPRAPFRFQRAANHPRAVIAIHQAPGGPRRAMLSFDDDAPVVQLDDGVERLDEVLELSAGPASDHWRIETSVYSIRWPDMFAVQSTAEPPGFDLVGPNEAMVFLQGPFDPRNLPPLTEMASPGQVVHRLGANWVELDYQKDEAPWRQVHRLVGYGDDVVVVTSQAPESWNALVGAAAIGVAESLMPTIAG